MKKGKYILAAIGSGALLLFTVCTPKATPLPPSTPAPAVIRTATPAAIRTPTPSAIRTATPAAIRTPTKVAISTPSAETWKPDKNITWICPYNPGGGFDAISRAIAGTMKKYLPGGINVIVQNKLGGGGRLARTYMWRAKPDGYTIAIINAVGALAEAVTLKEKIEYDIEKFTYFAQINYVPIMMSVAKHSPYRSIDDLKKATRPLRVPTPGVGVSDFFNGVIMCKALGIPMTSVAGYRTSAESMIGAVRGDSDLCFWSTAALSFVESGDLIPLVVFDNKRFDSFPDVPCASEVGLVGDEFTELLSTLRLVYGPPNMPRPLASYYEELSRKALNDPDYLKWAKGARQPAQYASGEEGMKRVLKTADIYRKYEKAIEDAAKQISG